MNPPLPSDADSQDAAQEAALAWLTLINDEKYVERAGTKPRPCSRAGSHEING